MTNKRMTKKQSRKLRQDGILVNGEINTNKIRVSKDIQMITQAQKESMEAWDEGYHLMFHGCAGTGKSFLGIYLALRAILRGEQKRLIVIRSAVPSRNIGFLQGNKAEKEKAFEDPYGDIFNTILERGDSMSLMAQMGLYQFATTSYLRGVTFDDSIVFLDEAASMTYHELDTVITRMGKNSRLICAGDINQNDLENQRGNEKSGLHSFMSVLENMESFDMIEFTTDDIVRSGLVKEYLLAKEKTKV